MLGSRDKWSSGWSKSFKSLSGFDITTDSEDSPKFCVTESEAYQFRYNMKNIVNGINNSVTANVGARFRRVSKCRAAISCFQRKAPNSSSWPSSDLVPSVSDIVTPGDLNISSFRINTHDNVVKKKAAEADPRFASAYSPRELCGTILECSKTRTVWSKLSCMSRLLLVA